MIPNGWSDDGVELRAPNGISVVKRFREHILSQLWDAENWPLRPEYASACREIETREVSLGVRQDFRVGSLGWTEKMGAHRISVEEDALGYLYPLAETQVQIAAFQERMAAAQAENAMLHRVVNAAQGAKDAIEALAIAIAKMAKTAM